MIRSGEGSYMDRCPSLPPVAQESREKFVQYKDFRCGNSSIISGVADSSSVSSRCSVRLIHEMVSRFSPEQVELVRSIGFDGLLHMPMLKQINLRFSTALMSKVDELSQTLTISDDTCIEFDKSDVAKVFGIPVGGKSVLSNSGFLTQPDNAIGRFGGGINTAQLRSLKAAQAIVSRGYGGIMSSVEQDEFKAAFVVVVMSALLAPSAKHDRVGDDYMHAIIYPSDISSYDWSEYVLRRLLDAVSKLKLDTANNVKSPYIYGCSLFLQVLYLDSIELGVLSMPHTVFPRIRCFTADRLRSMIVAVTSLAANGAEVTHPRLSKLRDSDSICYHWANQKLPNVGGPNDTGMEHLWDSVLLMTRVMKIPLEAAGPLFVAAADIQRRKRSEPGTEALDNMCLLLQIMEPFVNGFRYQSSFNVDEPLYGWCPLRHPHRCTRSDCCLHFASVNYKRSLSSAFNNSSASTCNEDHVSKRRFSDIGMGVHSHGSQCSQRYVPVSQSDLPLDFSHRSFLIAHEFDMRAISAMARFYLTLRPIRATRCSDLNLLPCTDVREASTSAPRSPWDLGCMLSIDVCRADVVWRRLSLVEDIDEPWIVHFCPKYIEVHTASLKAQFLGHSEFVMEMFDAVIRRFKQLDDALYATESNLRWRHFVESDFMVSLLAGWFDIKDPVVRSHFYSRHIVYEVTSCEIIFFPLLMQFRWVCLAWRMKDNTIVVYDPWLLQKSISSSRRSYESVVTLLKSAMSLVASTYSPWWSNQWDKASLEFFVPNDSKEPCTNRSGLLCLYFCRCFDGHRLVPPLAEVSLQDWASMVLADVSELSGNVGSVPSVFR